MTKTCLLYLAFPAPCIVCNYAYSLDLNVKPFSNCPLLLRSASVATSYLFKALLSFRNSAGS
jgi:hypothetical protein